MKSKVNLWLPVVVWCGLIFYLSSRPSPPTGSWLIPMIAHFFLYGILFILFWRASKKLKDSYIFGLLYAITDEFHQSFVPTRTPGLEDILVDLLGMLIAGLFILKVIPKMPQKYRLLAKRFGIIF